ncbi:hypothetical protein QJS66_18140 [Kocuria rhizophila]|nr:hypothetical protein QJS66_18140 [Kocuria rhizophila]
MTAPAGAGTWSHHGSRASRSGRSRSRARTSGRPVRRVRPSPPEDVAPELRRGLPRLLRALRMTAGRTLRLELTVTNTGSETFEVEGGPAHLLHVGDSSGSRICGLEGASFYDKVAKEQRVPAGRAASRGGDRRRVRPPRRGARGGSRARP